MKTYGKHVGAVKHFALNFNQKTHFAQVGFDGQSATFIFFQLRIDVVILFNGNLAWNSVLLLCCLNIIISVVDFTGGRCVHIWSRRIWPAGT